MIEFRSEDFHVRVHAAESEAAREILTPDAMRLVRFDYGCYRLQNISPPMAYNFRWRN
jgi:hypothetical protein